MQRTDAASPGPSYRGTTTISGRLVGNRSGTGNAARAPPIRAYAIPTPMALEAASPEPNSTWMLSSSTSSPVDFPPRRTARAARPPASWARVLPRPKAPVPKIPSPIARMDPTRPRSRLSPSTGADTPESPWLGSGPGSLRKTGIHASPPNGPIHTRIVFRPSRVSNRRETLTGRTRTPRKTATAAPAAPSPTMAYHGKPVASTRALVPARQHRPAGAERSPILLSPHPTASIPSARRS